MTTDPRNLAYRPGPGLLVPADLLTINRPTEPPAPANAKPPHPGKRLAGYILTAATALWLLLLIDVAIIDGNPFLAVPYAFITGLLGTFAVSALAPDTAWEKHKAELIARCDQQYDDYMNDTQPAPEPLGDPYPHDDNRDCNCRTCAAEEHDSARQRKRVADGLDDPDGDSLRAALTIAHIENAKRKDRPTYKDTQREKLEQEMDTHLEMAVWAIQDALQSRNTVDRENAAVIGIRRLEQFEETERAVRRLKRR